MNQLFQVLTSGGTAYDSLIALLSCLVCILVLKDNPLYTEAM